MVDEEGPGTALGTTITTDDNGNNNGTQKSGKVTRVWAIFLIPSAHLHVLRAHNHGGASYVQVGRRNRIDRHSSPVGW